jgi:hypothetical protein
VPRVNLLLGISLQKSLLLRGEPEEVPSCFEFANEAKDCGALLTVVRFFIFYKDVEPP